MFYEGGNFKRFTAGSCAMMVLIPCCWCRTLHAFRTPGAITGGFQAPGRVSQVGQVWGEGPGDITPPGPPGWRFGLRPKTLPRKKKARRYRNLWPCVPAWSDSLGK